jgi:2-polyprenyl-3-methyl-5-hydroxy-6-metoxy-1,4-benzoquinol methylase
LTDPRDQPYPENIFGHLQRLYWFRDRLSRSDRILDLGCGTGYFVTIPLLRWGYNVVGVDLDQASIEYGRGLLAAEALNPEALQAVDAVGLPGVFDAVILTEVLEHLSDREIAETLALVHAKLAPGGRLLVTVPNGYGWFELESYVWYRLGLERLYRRTRTPRITRMVRRSRSIPADVYEPMSLSQTPHVQRFTWKSLDRRLRAHGFGIREGRGAVLVCGPISDLLFSGVSRIMRLNKSLGERLTPLASDFYIVAEKV